MIIYVADERAVYSGEFNLTNRAYRAIRQIDADLSVDEAASIYGMVTFWVTRAGRIF